MHLKIAHSKEHQLQRPLPQLYRQQPGKIALNLSLRNLRPLRSKVSELSQCRLPTATTTPLRRQFLRCLIGFFVIASRWLPETPPLSSGPRELGKQAFGQGSLCKAESGHLEHLRAFHFVQRSTSSFAPGLEAPTRVSNASDFYRITGRLEGSNVVCHSFPSLSEAKAYCEGAGFRLPSQHQWR